ncbi:MAG: hypothetical protein KatS3mg105_2815 [Gemmatales bacterium]|nr:MAG: hypothetical protein KatS3mg105_2815 [Gemmatales bacterium]
MRLRTTRLDVILRASSSLSAVRAVTLQRLFAGLFLLAAFCLCNGARSQEQSSEKIKTEKRAAEEILRLERVLKSERAELAKVEKELQNPPADFQKAEAEFKSLSNQVNDLEQKIEELKKNKKTAELAELEKKLPQLKKSWEMARDKYALFILERKTLQDKAATLREQIEKDQAALDKLKGAGTATEKMKEPQEKEPIESTNKSSPKLEDKNLRKALEQAKQKEEEAREAEETLATLYERIQGLQKRVAVERRVLEAAQMQEEQTRKELGELEAQLRDKIKAKAPPAEIAALEKKIRDAQRRLADSESEQEASRNRIAGLQARMTALQAEQSLALEMAEQKRKAAEEAKKTVDFLMSPIHPRNLLKWLTVHGPKMALILIGFLLLYWLMCFAARRLFVYISRLTRKRHHIEEEARARTLQNGFRQMARIILATIAILTVLDEIGVSITTLLGGVAVVGLAFSFAAQNLLKDYFNGVMILIEDQFCVGDIVKLGDISGVVEQITMRVTVVRDLEGVLHFIPNGTMSIVSNLTHGWSRALFDIGVAYKENVDRVMKILLEIAAEMRRDPSFGPLILDEPEMLGVDALADSSVVIKFFIKTRPLAQFQVKREMLRRIKNRFDELGIEIPFPHRTLYHRHVSTENGANGQVDKQTAGGIPFSEGKK